MTDMSRMASESDHC